MGSGKESLLVLVTDVSCADLVCVCVASGTFLPRMSREREIFAFLQESAKERIKLLGGIVFSES